MSAGTGVSDEPEPRATITTFKDEFATTKKEVSWSWTQLAETAQRTTAPAKKQLFWIKLARFGNVRTTKNSLRHDANIIEISGIEGDYDAEEVAIDDAVAALERHFVKAIVAASPSHTNAKPRWRVLVPLSRPMTVEEYGTGGLHDARTKLLGRLNGVLGGILAGESFTHSQSYYLGGITGNPDHRVVMVDGKPIDLLPELDAGAIGKPGTKPGGQNGGGGTYSGPLDEDEQIRLIEQGLAFHGPIIRLTGSWFNQGVSYETAKKRLHKAFDACPEETKQTERWASRRNSIDRELRYVYEKEADARDAEAEQKSSRKKKQPAPGGVRLIEVGGGKRHEQALAGLNALIDAKIEIYRRHTDLVCVAGIAARDANGKKLKIPGIKKATAPYLGHELGVAAYWQKYTDEGEPYRVDPPAEVVKQILDISNKWPDGIEVLSGVIGTATLRPDGSLLLKPGFDSVTGRYLYAPPKMPPIPERPTRQDAEEALTMLNTELLSEFPFVCNVSRAVAMSGMISVVVRPALGGAVPLHLLNAYAPGTGKSYLVDLITAIALGVPAPALAVAPNSEDETEKRLVGAAMRGSPVISIDNCNGVLGGDFLCQVTERPTMELRPLGTSDNVFVENMFVCFANGNNITVKADLAARRTVRCNLDADMENPSDRQFSSPTPFAKIIADRGRYIAAILTIVRAFHCAGRPVVPPPVASYDGWSQLVCGALMWLGWPNPAESMTELRSEDPVRQVIDAVFQAWPGRQTEYTAAELIAEAQSTVGHEYPGEFSSPNWREAILPVAKNRRGELDVVVFGHWLKNHKGRIAGNRKLMRVGTETRPRWTLEDHA